MTKTFEEQVAYYNSHAPSCIANFLFSSVTMTDFTFDGHAGVTINSCWLIKCKCGWNAFRVRGYHYDVPNWRRILISPIYLECSDCSTTVLALDTHLHGYDPMNTDNDRYDPKVGGPGSSIHGLTDEGPIPGTHFCSKCDASEFELIARFEYGDDCFEEEFEEFRGREADLFTWTTILGKCQNCEEVQSIADFECA